MPLVGVMLLMLAGTAQTNGATACPATQPPMPAFVPPIPYSSAPFGEGNFLIGTNELWVSLPRQSWSGLRHKMFWWRPGFDGAKENHPNLTVTVKPVNSAVTTSVDRPATNAHFGGEWSMLIMVDFPTFGCWEVRGTYGGHSVAFVAWIEP